MTAALQFPCQQCGGSLAYEAGTDHQKCPYCGSENKITAATADTTEYDYAAGLQHAERQGQQIEAKSIECKACGAIVKLPPMVKASACTFCGSNLVTTGMTRALKPQGLLPFKVNDRDARELFSRWVKSLWFAPNALKRLARVQGRLAGIYVPYWTYDARTQTRYLGERGTHYYVTESYTTTVNGRTERRTRQVQKTRWSPAAGTVRNDFNDVLVLGSQSLPRDYAERLEPWDLEHLTAVDDAYLAGFVAEVYTIGLQAGFTRAKERMEPTIRETICADIGGDEQRIISGETRYADVSFKHLLLPIWLAAYHYQQKSFRFLVNGRTGEVHGERPYSWLKITAAVILGIIIALALFALFNAHTAQAAEVRVRAREHYERVRIEDQDDNTQVYEGFTNTIDAWYEEPFRYSVGFAGSPLFASLMAHKALSGFDDRIRLIHLGVEGKVFPAPDLAHVFLRAGIFRATLDARGDVGKLQGQSRLAGLGYEFNLDGVGLAPEMSWRQGNVEDGVHFAGTAPALGVHFYKLLSGK